MSHDRSFIGAAAWSILSSIGIPLLPAHWQPGAVCLAVYLGWGLAVIIYRFEMKGGK